MPNRIALKFADCRSCIFKRTSTCVRCQAGEFFEGREAESDEADFSDLHYIGLEMTRDD